MDAIKKYLGTSKATTILYIALFFAFSWLSYGAYIRFDVSSQGAMRISGTTKNLLRNLPEKASFELFVSNDLPDEAILVARKARDFIQEYVNSSRGRVKMTILDPDNDKAAQSRAADLHIQQLDLRVGGSKKAQAQSIYFGLAITYGSQSETVNNLINLFEARDLENQLTTKIFKLVHPNEKKIALLTGHGDFNLKKENSPTSLSFLQEKIGAAYGDLVEVNTTTGDIPVEVSTLIIVQPGKLEPIDLFRIDQFVMRGGNLVVAASGMQVNFSQQFMASPGNPDLGEFLKGYGIELAADMINEPKDQNQVPFVTQTDKVRYPPWIIVQKDGLSQESLITKGNGALILPYTSSVKTNGTLINPADNKFKVEILAKSTADSWAQANFAFLDPNRMNDVGAQQKPNAGTYNLAMLVKGKFTSQFATKAPPKEAPSTYSKVADKDSHILVVGSPFVFSNMVFLMSAMHDPIGVRTTGKAVLLEENFKLLIPTIDLMQGNEELLELRKKGSQRVRPKVVEDGMRKFLTLLAFAIPLLTILAFGAYRLNKRKNLNPIAA